MEEKILKISETEMLSEEEYRALPSLADASPVEIAKEIARVLDNKRGRNIKVLYVEDQTVIADYFVLCTGNSGTHLKALMGEVEYRLSLRGVEAHHVEGRDNDTWMIGDYSSVLVHVFSREARDFYNLDKLYNDAQVIDF